MNNILRQRWWGSKEVSQVQTWDLTLLKIHQYQKSTSLLIHWRPLHRLFWELGQWLGQSNIQFQFWVLINTAGGCRGIFEWSLKDTINAKRGIIMPRDMQLARHIREENPVSSWPILSLCPVRVPASFQGKGKNWILIRGGAFGESTGPPPDLPYWDNRAPPGLLEPKRSGHYGLSVIQSYIPFPLKIHPLRTIPKSFKNKISEKLCQPGSFPEQISNSSNNVVLFRVNFFLREK